MNLNQFHKNFLLNGNSFKDKEQLIAFSLTISKTLNQFLKEWFSDSDVLIVQTSGSTGTPKKIPLKKEFMFNSAQATGDFFKTFENTKALCCLPLEYIAGKMMLLRALTLGWHIDVIEPSTKPLQEINQDYDFSAMVPLQVQNSLEKLSLIDQLIIGGGVVSESLQAELQKVKTKCFATYGMTETITHIAVKHLNLLSPRSRSLSASACGRQEVKESFYEVLPNITVSQDNRGCLVINAPRVSSEIVVTNDVVELISKTEFIWKGRVDNVINSGGVKLHPEEIEKKLSSILEQRFFVAGIPDEKLGERLVLIVEGNSTVISDEVEKSLQSQSVLSKYEIPKEIHFVPYFIETETKKIQRKKTLDLILSR